MARILLPTDDALAAPPAAVQAGHLVAFPTETVYGLGANAWDADAVAKIFAAKGRPATNPLIVHGASLEDVADVADVGAWHAIPLHNAAPLRALAERFWPGPLTLVLPKSPRIPDIVTAGGPTVAVRVPRHPVALALLQAAGTPLAAPSANRSEGISPTRAAHVAQSLGDAVDIILDGGATEVGLESTVLDLTVWPPRLLRPGMVSETELEAVLGLAPASGPQPNHSGAARSPGQSLRHYAPRTPLQIVPDAWAAATPTAALLCHTPPPAPPLPPHRAAAVLRSHPRAYAAALYETLHRLDRLGASVIFVEAVPETADWLAVWDRLARAAEPTPPAR